MKKKIGFIFIILFFMELTILPGFNETAIAEKRNSNYVTKNVFYDESLKSSSNIDTINSILDQKIEDFNTLGYFPQIYESSLEAIYYAIYSLDVIGRLETIDTDQIFNSIMSFYNSSAGYFLDSYALRYLDTDFDMPYISLTPTLLKVNCYAILTLKLISKLSAIDNQSFKDFIWSCFHPIESGFIGQPYSAELHPNFRISTADNSYYAILALDVLGENYSTKISERAGLINYLGTLQSTSFKPEERGGFKNDLNFQSLFYLDNEPNLFSSYYCIKGLEVLGFENFIDIDEFEYFLSGIYKNNSAIDYFIPTQIRNLYRFNIVSSALGLELSDMYNYTSFSIDRTDVINFILNGRNSVGLWKRTTNNSYAELIDTYQVLHALNESSEISNLGASEKNQIAASLEKYSQYNGFSLLSEDYTSLELIHTIISAAEIFNKSSQINKQEIYNQIENIFFNETNTGFYANIKMESDNELLRSSPIEYFCYGNYNYISEYNDIKSHKSTFFALDSLVKIDGIDEFEEIYLNQTKINIINSQFLNYSASNYGGFLSHIKYSTKSQEEQNKRVFLEDTYYAIKSLELIADKLNISDITALNFNTTALNEYLTTILVETPNILSFQPNYSKTSENILQSTYYAIYILKTINKYNLNNQKIKNFIDQIINYTNIKNIYYCFKIDDLLNLNIDFNTDLTSNIINLLYSDVWKEYYFTLDKNSIGQEILFWISEMYDNDIGLDTSIHYQVDIGTLQIEMNASLKTLVGPKLLNNPKVYLEIYKNGQFLDSKEFIMEISEIQRFTLTYNFLIYENYTFKIYLDDIPAINHLELDEYRYLSENQADQNENSFNYTGDLMLSIPLMTTIIAVPSSVIFLESRRKKRMKLKFS